MPDRIDMPIANHRHLHEAIGWLAGATSRAHMERLIRRAEDYPEIAAVLRDWLRLTPEPDIDRLALISDYYYVAHVHIADVLAREIERVQTQTADDLSRTHFVAGLGRALDLVKGHGEP